MLHWTDRYNAQEAIMRLLSLPLLYYLVWSPFWSVMCSAAIIWWRRLAAGAIIPQRQQAGWMTALGIAIYGISTLTLTFVVSCAVILTVRGLTPHRAACWYRLQGLISAL